MTRRTLAVAALAVLLAAPARAADVDPLLPAETEFITFVNFRQLIDSEITKKYALDYAKNALQDDKIAPILKDLGLDPLKDLDRATLATWGQGREGQEAFAILRGKFDPEKLFNAATAAARNNGDTISIVDEGTYKLVKMSQPNEQKPFYVAVADEKTVLGASDPKKLTAALDIAESGKGKPALKRDMAMLMLQQDEKASFYSIGVLTGQLDKAPPGLGRVPGINQDRFAAGLAAIKTFAMTLRVTDEVGLEFALGMKEVSDAEDFEQELSGLIDTAKTFVPLLAVQRPRLKGFTDEVSKTLKSKVKNKDVLVSVKLSADAVGAALETIMERGD